MRRYDNVILTPRLTLRHPRRADVGFLAQILGAADVRRYLGGPLSDAALANAIESYMTRRRDAHHWMALADKTPCGIVSLTPHKDGTDTELSYQFDPGQWGKGYATEAGQAVVKCGLQTFRLPCIIAETQAANTASRRLLARLEMRETARITRFGAAQVIYTTKGSAPFRYH